MHKICLSVCECPRSKKNEEKNVCLALAHSSFGGDGSAIATSRVINVANPDRKITELCFSLKKEISGFLFSFHLH